MIEIINDDGFNKLILSVYNQTIETLNVENCFDVEIEFVDNVQIKKLNREYRNIDKVTDVLSFPNLEIEFPFDKSKYLLDINPMTENIILGEIAICFEVVEKQAEEYGNTLEREMAYMTVHGLLHLFGYDHIEESDKKLMREKEEEILSKLNLTKEA